MFKNNLESFWPFEFGHVKHSYKKRKDSLETRAEQAVFSLKLEFRKIFLRHLEKG